MNEELTCNERPPSLMESTIESLDKELACLNDVVGSLESKISVCLLPSNPRTKEDGEDDQDRPKSDLAKQIDKRAEAICQIRKRIAELVDRISL